MDVRAETLQEKKGTRIESLETLPSGQVGEKEERSPDGLRT